METTVPRSEGDGSTRGAPTAAPPTRSAFTAVLDATIAAHTEFLASVPARQEDLEREFERQQQQLVERVYVAQDELAACAAARSAMKGHEPLFDTLADRRGD